MSGFLRMLFSVLVASSAGVAALAVFPDELSGLADRCGVWLGMEPDAADGWLRAIAWTAVYVLPFVVLAVVVHAALGTRRSERPARPLGTAGDERAALARDDRPAPSAGPARSTASPAKPSDEEAPSDARSGPVPDASKLELIVENMRAAVGAHPQRVDRLKAHLGAARRGRVRPGAADEVPDDPGGSHTFGSKAAKRRTVERLAKELERTRALGPVGSALDGGGVTGLEAPLAVGKLGRFPHAVTVIQVIGDRSLVIDCNVNFLPPGARRWTLKRYSVYVEGIDASRCVDGDRLDLEDLFIISGTKSYRRADGSTATEYLAEPIDVAPYVEHARRHQLLLV